jgi:hypothetical protein
LTKNGDVFTRVYKTLRLIDYLLSER